MANNVDQNSSFTQDLGVYKGTALGTVAGTTTLANNPAFLSHVNITNGVASGAITLYDSAGTSVNVLGTINLGTSIGFDLPKTIHLKWQTKTGLTIVNSANVGLQAFFLP